MVEVTDEDRKAAASVAVLVEMRELILSGRADHHAEPWARRRMAGYQAAIADVVEWLGECADTHEAVALDIAGNALGDGFYNADAATRYRAAANEITRRFGKGQDQNPVK